MLTRLLRSKIFWFGLAIRIVCLPLFAGSNLSELFIPFVDSAVTGQGMNPWATHPAHFFPYGFFLFLLLFFPKKIGFLLFGEFALGSSPLSLALMKAPLLVIDFFTLYFLCNWRKDQDRALLWLYWLNPIVIYVSFIYGQLDIASTFFALASLMFLAQRQTLKSSIFLALATLSKFHVIVLIPFILAYLWNTQFSKQAIRSISTWCAAWFSLSLIGFLPNIMANQMLYTSTASPEALRIFGAQIPFGESQTLYLGILVVMVTIGRLCLSTRISERGLIYGGGLILGSLLVATSPAPGWVLWIMPVLALLFSQYRGLNPLLMVYFNFVYFLHFVAVPKIAGTIPFAEGVGFTIFEVSLLGFLAAIWVLVIRHEAVLKGRTRPRMIGIAGDSASGKNHLSSILSDLFSERNTLVIEGDDYHKWERNHIRWQEYTHLNPKANHLPEMANHTRNLSKGLTIKQAHYDHGEGRFTAPREIKPSRTMILQGLHTFYLRQMRSTLDLKIFLAPDEAIRLAWKLERDVRGRGYTPERVIQTLEKRRADSEAHINPQKNFADWIIEYFPKAEISSQQIVEGKEVDLGMRYTLWNDAPITPLFERLSEVSDCSLKVSSAEQLDRLVLEFRTGPTVNSVQAIAEELFPSIRHITRGWTAPNWRPGFEGITQLTTLALLSEKGEI